MNAETSDFLERAASAAFTARSNTKHLHDAIFSLDVDPETGAGYAILGHWVHSLHEDLVAVENVLDILAGHLKDVAK
jgi:hypothetical protein